MATAFAGSFQGARVFVTGHTGFKGSWLCEWLLQLGAEVHGYALAPEHGSESLFARLRLAERLAQHRVADLRDRSNLDTAVRACAPDVVFHLAAQPLVRRSYAEPRETWEVNVLGTVNVLEAVRHEVPGTCAVVCVTTDKCYENREWPYGYRECDRLGGHDPYSSSKAAAELAIRSWRASLLPGERLRVASARAGNVHGGGDRAADRIVPDFFRARAAGRPLRVRNPAATRPWQHLLEPLSGYLQLAVRLRRTDGFSEAWNFGPESESCRPVRDLVRCLARLADCPHEESPEAGAPHEAGLLQLSIEKARQRLGWWPVWNFERGLAETVAWELSTEEPAARCRLQIGDYVRAAADAGLSWALGHE